MKNKRLIMSCKNNSTCWKNTSVFGNYIVLLVDIIEDIHIERGLLWKSSVS